MLANQYPWGQSLFIYTEYFSNFVKQQIQEIKVQQSDQISSKSFSAFDLLHVCGNNGIDWLITHQIGQNPKVIEAGSGLGGSARYLNDKTGAGVLGIDILPHFVELSNMMTELSGQQEAVKFVQGDINAAELKKEEYDGAISVSSYLINVDDSQGLGNMYESLKPGGWLYLEDAVALKELEDVPEEYKNIIIEHMGFTALRSYQNVIDQLNQIGFTVIDQYDQTTEVALAIWTRSEQLLKQFKEDGENGDEAYLHKIEVIGRSIPKAVSTFKDFSDEDIMEKFPHVCEYIPNWREYVHGEKYIGSFRIFAIKPEQL